MAFPSDDEIRAALLDYVAKRGGSASVEEIASALAKKLKLNEVDLAQRIPHSRRDGGESAWKQRLRRVRHTLVKSGKLAADTQRGVWSLAKPG